MLPLADEDLQFDLVSKSCSASVAREYLSLAPPGQVCDLGILLIPRRLLHSFHPHQGATQGCSPALCSAQRGASVAIASAHNDTGSQEIASLCSQ